MNSDRQFNTAPNRNPHANITARYRLRLQKAERFKGDARQFGHMLKSLSKETRNHGPSSIYNNGQLANYAANQNRAPRIPSIPSILVIEDEEDLRAVLHRQLSEMPAHIELASEGAEGLRLALAQQWDVILLDLRIPNIDGLDVCRQIRAQGVHTPIIMLTALSSELNRVLGLELGADDYVTKPFSMLELQSRIKAQMRKTALIVNAQNRATIDTFVQSESLQFGGLTLDLVAHCAHLDGQLLELTPTEWQLLKYFTENPNQAISRSQLLEKIWGQHQGGYDHTLNSHINRLRAKLVSTKQSACYIRTVWGFGYSLEKLAVA